MDYDVIIVGGGMVGSMLAALLARHTDLTLAVLEKSTPEPFKPGSDPDYDIRVSALSIATQRMLESAGAWQGILDRRACVYREMLVWDGEQSGSTHFRSEDIGAEALGHIVENRVIQLALLDCINQADNVDFLCPADVQSVAQHDEHVAVTIGERCITGKLLIGADGARSSLRDMLAIDMHSDAYEHHALVATVMTELPQQQITWQRFMPSGPQAFLPLCGSAASMVWYHSADEVMRLKSLDDDEFVRELVSSFPDRLGGIKSVQARASFPIAKAHASSYIAERVALVGDAAHTVHPLAGQGVNLGMMDASAMAELVMDAHEAGADIGARRLLRRYERWRRSDNALMISVLDGFYHAFKPQPTPVRVLRSAAMNIADKAGPLKQLVMRYAMGTSGDIPRFAR